LGEKPKDERECVQVEEWQKLKEVKDTKVQ
jgi:hypothetical protein